MNSSLDRLPEGTLTRAIRSIGETEAEFKSRQRTTGRSGQLGYAVESALDWDYEITLPPTLSAQYVELILTFTGDGSQKFPIVIPASDIRVNGTGDANKLTLSPNGQWIYSNGGNVVLMYALDQPDPAYFESETQLAWLIGFEYLGSITFRLKARGQASTDGTWSVVRIL